MSTLNKVMTYDDYQIGQHEIILSYLSDLNIKPFSETTVYNAGDLIYILRHNELCIYKCKYKNTRGVFDEYNWDIYTLNNRLNEELIINDNRKIITDVMGIKAFTDINGMSLKDVLLDLIFIKQPMKILSKRDVFFDINNTDAIVSAEFSYKETSDPIEIVELTYNNSLIGYSDKSEDSIKIELNINNNKFLDKHEILYRVKYRNDRLDETGVALNIYFVYPAYVGISEDPSDPLKGLEMKLVEPNSSITIAKNAGTLGAPTIFIESEQWSKLSDCKVNNLMDITNSLSYDSTYIGGFPYTRINAYPTMSYGNSYTFNFNNE